MTAIMAAIFFSIPASSFRSLAPEARRSRLIRLVSSAQAHAVDELPEHPAHGMRQDCRQ
ncbi:MAG: hypothetical protein OXE82_08840 [Rhodobacter sp.]|nr:hypothetical protein [Rhodobacter sp.]